MAEMILPGTYIEVRAEGLIVPSRVTVGNIGIVGTASKGPIGQAVVVGSYVEARQKFGDYDPWIDGNSGELTMVRALELIFGHGATTVFALRVASASAKAATYLLSSASGDCVRLAAKTEGTWGNTLQVKVAAADQSALIEGETLTGGGAMHLAHSPVVTNARNRVKLFTDSNGLTRSLEIIDTGTPNANQVKIDPATGTLTFVPALAAADVVTATYLVDKSKAAKVTIKLGRSEEVYTVVSGDHLAAAINRSPGGSAWVTATALANSSELPSTTSDFGLFGTGANTRGQDGSDASDADYKNGLDLLLNEEAHIIVAAGKTDGFGAQLDSHCQVASTDALRHDRIGVLGSALGASLDTIRGHNLDSDRLIFVAPGIQATDAPSGKAVTLPGAYAAAAIAGLLASLPPHVSLTNKPISVNGLENKYTNPELGQLVQDRVLGLEARQGFRVVKGITTATFTAFAQITTRRIVDYAKYGVRSAASSYIGLLNNERVRGALHTTIASFLNQMLADEMLISYDLNVSATREEERQGIVQVTMVLRPVFSIDFIKVTMFLE
jgi:hypothetical protein